MKFALHLKIATKPQNANKRNEEGEQEGITAIFMYINYANIKPYTNKFRSRSEQSATREHSR